MKTNTANLSEPAGQVPSPPTEPSSGPGALASIFHDGPINILIVDDEPKNLTVLETVLDNPGYRLVRAESADQALLALVMEEFALLILDIRMPGMTGFELAQMIKERKKTARVPIIFLTAYYNEDQHVLEGYYSGAVDYLHKPVNPAILRSKVSVFAELHHKSRECAMANRALLGEVAERRHAEDRLRALTQRVEQAQEAERGRVANELRVNITQLLYVILGRCQALAEKLPAGNSSACGDTNKINEMVSRTAEEVERIWRSLWSHELEKLGLVPALEIANAEFVERTGVALQMDFSALDERLPAEVELVLYRIIQKALNNVERHAHARHVMLLLTKPNGFIQLTIKDDGNGFDPDRPAIGEQKGGLGLLRMRERVASMGGVLSVNSSPHTGTEIEVRIPLPLRSSL